MKDDYFDYYILSYFNRRKVTRLSQILHVLRGKRTPSMFYITEVNNWHHGFSIEKRIESKDLKKIVNDLMKRKFLVKKEDGYLLTLEGAEEAGQYFKRHYFPNKVLSFSNVNLYRPFWDRIQLFTQVFSEYSYQNTQYFPVIKNPVHQEKVRQLFQAASGNIESFFNQWVKEQEYLFGQMDERKATVFMHFLTGYGKIGKTRGQIAKELKMQDYEFNFYLRDLLEELVKIIKEDRKKLPLIYEILEQTNEEIFLGLSQSTYQSYHLLKQGAGIRQIAESRKIKENTVKEHILEMAFIVDDFPAKDFVPKKVYNHLSQIFENKREYSFKEARLDFEELEFYQYRLVELERMRSK